MYVKHTYETMGNSASISQRNNEETELEKAFRLLDKKRTPPHKAWNVIHRLQPEALYHQQPETGETAMHKCAKLMRYSRKSDEFMQDLTRWFRHTKYTYRQKVNNMEDAAMAGRRVSQQRSLSADLPALRRI